MGSESRFENVESLVLIGTVYFASWRIWSAG